MPASAALAIQPRGPLDARVRVPGSKSFSNRALVVAALSDGESRLSGLLDSDDTQRMAEAVTALGARVEQDGDEWTVRGTGGRLEVPARTLDIGASGTAARFVTAMMALVPGQSVLDGTARMRERPIADLTDALVGLGIDVEARGPGGCPPVHCRGGRLGGEVEIDASRSSQYVSALLLVAPYAAEPVVLRLRDGVLVSRPYVDLTLDIMADFGASARFRDATTLEVGLTHYAARDYAVEPDASTAAYFFAAAAVTGGRVVVEGLGGGSRQADMGLLGVLERMGCEVERHDDHVVVAGPREGLGGVEVDMSDMPDAVLAAAVTAAFADGPSRIFNVGNLRIKESDRLAALETELVKLGVEAHATEDSLSIVPGPLSPAVIDTYDDHRIAMAFAVAGLRVPGIEIRDPGCVSKSWPGYFEALERLS